MIKYFRNIRKNLFSEGNAGKYLKYAIGEIILVVIGILIALSINNWNESHKKRKVEIVALNDLKNEFIYNARIFDEHLEFKKTMLATWENLINVLSNNSITKDGSLRRRQTGSDTFILSQSVLDKLLFTGEIDNLESDSLKYLLNSWNYIYKEYEDDEISHKTFMENHFTPYSLKNTPHVFFNNGTENPSENPFYSASEISQFILNAQNDLNYQNLLIRNHFWLNIVIEEGRILQNTMHKIINLLTNEIVSKQKR